MCRNHDWHRCDAPAERGADDFTEGCFPGWAVTFPLCSHPRPDRPRSDSLRWSLFLLVSWPLRTQGVLNMQASVASLSLSHFTLNRNYYRAYSVYHLVPALSKTHSMNRVQSHCFGMIQCFEQISWHTFIITY